MNGLQNDWYVAGPDGEAIGPLARVELARRHANGQFARDALAWHVEHGEWLPLSRVVIGLSALAAGPVAPPPPGRSGDAPPKPARKDPGATERRPPPPARPGADDRVASEARQLRELRERLAAGTAAAGASVAAARAAGGKAAGAAKADAAQSGQRLLLGLRRLLARAVDVLWIGVPVAALAAAAFGERDAGTVVDPGLLLWAALFVLVPLEALMLAAGGRTPGKALLGLRVQGPRGAPGFGAAWARATTVVWRGVGLGIPPLTLIAVIGGGVQLVNDGETPWDKAQGLSTRAEPLDNRGWQFGLVALLLGMVALASGWWSTLVLELLAGAAGR
jgi:hypothetical protein